MRMRKTAYPESILPITAMQSPIKFSVAWKIPLRCLLFCLFFSSMCSGQGRGSNN